MDLTSRSPTGVPRRAAGWFAENQPIDEPFGDEDAHFHWRADFQRRLADGGWAAVHWPVQYGGRGATLTQSAIFFEELGRSGAPLPANVLGLLLAGPTIMAWGTPEQKERYLTPILTAEEIWCQGFSEPDAGSDLAAVKTRAVRDGDDWVITGQKVWTSAAQYSKWCMLVARTDPDVAKHKGLSYFLMDMDQEAVAGPAAAPDHRRVGVQRAIHRRRPDPAREPARRRGQRLEGGADDADERARRTRVLPAGADAPAARQADRRGGGARPARRPDRRRAARRPAPEDRGAAAHGLSGTDRDREVRPARSGGVADQVDVVRDQPGADPAGGRSASARRR